MKENPHLLRELLSWKVDSFVYLAEYGAYFWLKPCYLEGKRIGITSCCESGFECEHHADLKLKLETQKTNSN